MSYRDLEEQVGGAIMLAALIGFFIGAGLTLMIVLIVIFLKGG
jgi:hypothetical protein